MEYFFSSIPVERAYKQKRDEIEASFMDFAESIFDLILYISLFRPPTELQWATDVFGSLRFQNRRHGWIEIEGISSLIAREDSTNEMDRIVEGLASHTTILDREGQNAYVAFFPSANGTAFRAFGWTEVLGFE